ncbi:hypothetical protein FQA39_LY04505 [Lamprigera yunnana]|nr:hypothetical protein FQA39_LY04505 [Lamprigera yunnana]
MWGNIKYNELVSPLKKISEESFLNILENQLDKNSVLLVFEEQSVSWCLSVKDLVMCSFQLSPEDFLLRNEENGSIFSMLPSLKESSSNYWSCVKNPIDAIYSLRDKNVIETTFSSFPTGSYKANDVVVFNLNDANEEEDRINMLQRHDKLISVVYDYFLKQFDNLVVLYTAYHPSWITTEEVRSHRFIRDTTGVKDDSNDTDITYVVFQNEEVILSAISYPKLYFNESEYVLFIKYTLINNFSCRIELKDFVMSSSNNLTKTEMFVQLVGPNTTTVTLFFEIDAGYWMLYNITVEYVTNAIRQEYYFYVKEIYAPFQFSYHCPDLEFFYPNNPLQYISFKNLQLQYFPSGDNNTQFGYAYDCVGFMSAPIWSGIFITFILILIMTCGLTMMMDIKTMDRFDDPKGKTITISAME